MHFVVVFSVVFCFESLSVEFMGQMSGIFFKILQEKTPYKPRGTNGEIRWPVWLIARAR